MISRISQELSLKKGKTNAMKKFQLVRILATAGIVLGLVLGLLPAGLPAAAAGSNGPQPKPIKGKPNEFTLVLQVGEHSNFTPQTIDSSKTAVNVVKGPTVAGASVTAAVTAGINRNGSQDFAVTDTITINAVQPGKSTVTATLEEWHLDLRGNRQQRKPGDIGHGVRGDITIHVTVVAPPPDVPTRGGGRQEDHGDKKDPGQQRGDQGGNNGGQPQPKPGEPGGKKSPQPQPRPGQANHFVLRLQVGQTSSFTLGPWLSNVVAGPTVTGNSVTAAITGGAGDRDVSDTITITAVRPGVSTVTVTAEQWRLNPFGNQQQKRPGQVGHWVQGDIIVDVIVVGPPPVPTPGDGMQLPPRQ